MIRAILGKKGSGKTKRIIDMANDALKTEHGDVVFIDDDDRYMYDLRHEIRFVNAACYKIKSADMFLGFLSGMLAQNFDITMICVDAFARLVKDDLSGMACFFERLAALSEEHKVDFVLSISGDPEGMPAFVTRYCA